MLIPYDISCYPLPFARYTPVTIPPIPKGHITITATPAAYEGRVAATILAMFPLPLDEKILMMPKPT